MTNNYFLNYCQESVLHAPQRENIRNCYLSVTMNLKEEKAKERERERTMEEKRNEHHLASTVFSASAIKLKGDLIFS